MALVSNASRLADPITIQTLSKKWKLDKYSVYGFSESPENREKNDYIFLKSDLTFELLDEGEKEVGTWRLNKERKRIFLSKKDEDGELILIIDQLENDELILIIDNPTDTDLKDVKIHYKN